MIHTQRSTITLGDIVETNNVINLNFVTDISTHNTNIRRVDVYQIQFMFDNEQKRIWWFLTKAERDESLINIMSGCSTEIPPTLPESVSGAWGLNENNQSVNLANNDQDRPTPPKGRHQNG
jgi:hypothetical protein